MRYVNQVRSVINSLAVQISTQPYANLVDDSFNRPNPCSLGAKSSCITIKGEAIEVIWSTVSSDNPAHVILTGQAIVNSDTSLKVTRTISPVSTQWMGSSGVINLTLNGASYSNNIYLLDSYGNVVTFGVPVNNFISLDVNALTCSNSHPCRLALTPSGSYTYAEYSLDPLNALGQSSKIVYSGDVLNIDVKINSLSNLTLAVKAINPDGRSTSPSLLHTLCLTLKFNDSISDRYVNSCNDKYPDKILFNTYQPYPSKPNNLLAIPNGTQFTVLTEKPGAACKPLGLSFYKNTWTSSVKECSSYTWGIPSSIDSSGTLYPFSLNTFTYPSTPTTYTVIYSTEAYPAAGFSGDNQWSYPRVARSCSVNSSCLPVSTNLEVTSCSNTYCFSSSNLPPVVTAPLIGAKQLLSLYSTTSSGTFNLTIKNLTAYSDSSTQIILKSAPDNASLTFNGSYLTDNQSITSFTGSEYQLELGYTSLNTKSFGEVVLEIKDRNSDSLITIPLSSSSVPVTVEPVLVDATQSLSSVLSYKIIGSDGNYLSGVSLTSQNLNGINLSTNTVSNSGGTVLLDASLASPVTGLSNVTVNLNKTYSGTTLSNAISIPIVVNPGLNSLKLSSTKININGTSTVSVSALDFTNNPLANQLVSFTILDNNQQSYDLLKYKPSSCITDSNGVCSVLLTASNLALAGTYKIVASSIGQSANLNINLSSRVSLFNLSNLTVLQNNSTKGVLILSNASGQPLSSHSATFDLPEGLTISTSGSSDSKGKILVTLTAGASANVGVNKVTVTSGGHSQDFTVLVQPKIARVTTSDLNLNQGEPLTVSLVAYDANNQPAKFADITINPYGLISPLIIKTDANGRAIFDISNSLTSLSTHTLTLSSSGETITTLNVNLVPQGFKISVDSTLNRGVSEQDLVVTLLNNAQPDSNTKVKIESLSKYATVTNPTLTTNSSGQVTFKITTSSKASGYLKFNINYNNHTITRSIWVKP